jgi:hypothetical protein
MKKLTFILSITLTLTAFAQVPSYVPTNGLVGWWPFNGNANDESGNGNNGTVNGATLTTDRLGIVNNAFDFNAFNWSWGSGGDYIYIPYNTAFNSTNITVSVWFTKSANYITNQSLPSIIKRFEGGYNNPNGQTWGILANTNGDLLSTFILPPNSTNTYSVTLSQDGPVISSNQWHNAVLTFDGTSMKTFFNGQFVTSIPANGMLMNTNGNSGISVGMSTQANGNWDPFNGKIDDIGIWNRALTPQEVAALYNGCQLSVNTQPTNQTINVNNNAQFVVSSSDPNATFQWQTDLGVGFQNLNSVGQYSGTTNDTLTVSNVTMSNNNQPFRCIINSGSCIDTSNVAVLTVNNNVGVVEQNQQQLLVYPNPVSSTLTIENPEGLISNFVIVDTQGREVLKGTLDTKLHSFYIAHLTSGIYTIIFEQKSIKEIKIIK